MENSTSINVNSSSRWTIKNVIMLVFLAFLFGGIFMGAGVIYSILSVALTPLGYKPFANEILFGLWTMAAPVAIMILKKPGSALLGEVLAALAEMLYGSYFGAGVLISGLIQGLGSEVGFTVSKYKRFSTANLIYSAIGITIFSFAYEFFKEGYSEFGTGMIISLFVVRFISVIIFNVVLVKAVMKLYGEIQNAASVHK